MLDHHIQRTIVTALKSADHLSFSELKPDGLDNKLFTYHLKIVIREGFVEKDVAGQYRLTPTGQKLWKRMNESPDEVALRPYSVLFIIIHSQENGWLLYRRNTHPAKGKVAFMHSTPSLESSIIDGARRDVLAKTALDCQFAVIGSGFFRTYQADDLVNFTNFTVLSAISIAGELDSHDQHADYFWDKNPDFSSAYMLPNMQLLADAYRGGSYPFFIDETVSYSS